MALPQISNQNCKYCIDFGILPNLDDALVEMVASPKQNVTYASG